MTHASKEAFAELKPAMSRNEALLEAHRCLFCFDAPCTRACPTHIDVPGFIKRIATDNLRGAARTILEANILGASCARVCPTEVLCEGACVLNDLHHRPIDIGRLQRYATDPVVIDDQVPLLSPPEGEPVGRVAIVGGGPAGLSCAAELRLRGWEARVFDAADTPGGLNTFGVADYKMDQATALREIAWIRQLGVEIHSGVRIGRDISVDELLDEFDAVFLGVGLGKVPPLGIPGEELDGVEDVLDFIRRLKSEPKEEQSLQGQRVAVIGGGNTAIDGVTQAARLGADQVMLVYRRGEAQMKAYLHEIELARQAGAIFILQAQPVAILGDEAGRVRALRCLRTELGPADDSGRAGFRLVEGSDFEVPCERVLRATGQAKQGAFFQGIEGVELDEGGRVVVDETFRTGHPRIWAGGDCVNGGKEVVNAVAHGKRAAQAIDDTLRPTAA